MLERKGTELWEASECPASDALDPVIVEEEGFQVGEVREGVRSQLLNSVVAQVQEDESDKRLVHGGVVGQGDGVVGEVELGGEERHRGGGEDQAKAAALHNTALAGASLRAWRVNWAGEGGSL